jgi:hypothetical protein
MFEKEAKEYAHNNYEILVDTDDAYVTSEAYLEQGYIAGAVATNKANEWHYVKDEDFPTDKTEKKYLVALKSEYGGFFYETDIWCESLHCFASNNPTKVYAWKEIILPKFPKESE